MDKHGEETESKRECRICHQNEENGLEGDAFISPCSCNGTHKFVHASCLIRWVQQDPINAYKCPDCTSDYYGCGVKTEIPDTYQTSALIEPIKEAMFTASLYFVLFNMICYLLCGVRFNPLSFTWGGRDATFFFVYYLWLTLGVFVVVHSGSVYYGREDICWKIIFAIRRTFAPIQMLILITFLVILSDVHELIGKDNDVYSIFSFTEISRIIAYLWPLDFLSYLWPLYFIQ